MQARLIAVFGAWQCGGSARLITPRSGTNRSAWPIGDIEAAHRIRDILPRRGAAARKKVGGSGDVVNKKARNEVERYQCAAKAAMEIAMKVSDELMRDARGARKSSNCASRPMI